MIPNALKRANVETSTLFLCDIQETFRPLIHNMPAMIHNSELLNSVCNVLNVPCVITEQYPKALGKTVPEITIHSNTKLITKTFFSMMVPELKAEIAPERKQVTCFSAIPLFFSDSFRLFCVALKAMFVSNRQLWIFSGKNTMFSSFAMLFLASARMIALSP
jgi:hypothetical protein